MANMANIIPPINLKQLALFPFCSDVDMRSRIVLTNPQKSAINILIKSEGLIDYSTTLFLFESPTTHYVFLCDGGVEVII